MNPTYDFTGQVALVTGAAKGMGLATARMFAESGAAVVLADLDGDLAAKEAERIVREGGTAIGIACDVADEAQVAAMVDRTVAEYGRLDMAFNNAGMGNHCDDTGKRHVQATWTRRDALIAVPAVVATLQAASMGVLGSAPAHAQAEKSPSTATQWMSYGG